VLAVGTAGVLVPVGDEGQLFEAILSMANDAPHADTMRAAALGRVRSHYGIEFLATRFIELAGEVNSSMPEHIINRVAEALNSHGKPVKSSRVLVLGLAYKANVDDDRESPSYVLMGKLKERGAEVFYHDPHIPEIKSKRDHSQWTGKKSVEWNNETIASFDATLISTAHNAVNNHELANWSSLIIDTRNTMCSVNAMSRQAWKA
jgi:UDP-N-acetyl-D-glucosamine dehydrogenase